MNIITKIYDLYFDGFKKMTLGKLLWKIVIIKILVVSIFLNYFIHDKSFKSEYKTHEEKIEFVYQNLIDKNK